MNALNRNALACAIVLALSAPVAQAQVFYQGFNICELESPSPPDCYSSPTAGGAGTYLFPSGWLLRNVDNRTPSAAVAYVNDAWEVREDFAFDVNQTVAFSTSWYTPAGAADDWMWTPAIALPAGNSVLSWRSVTYDPSYRDGYEVRVMTSPNVPTGGTGVLGNQVSNSTQIFSIAADNTAWTAHSVPLDTYAGQTVYVGFHNNSNDKFLLLIDDVKVVDATPDVVAQAPVSGFASEYSRAPDGFTVPVDFGFTAYNGGGSDVTNVIGNAQPLLDGGAFGLPLQSSPVATLPIGATAPIAFGSGHSVHGNGTWSVQYDLSATETPSETNTANNTLQVAAVAIGGNEFARDEGPVSGTLGIGAGNGGELGVALTLPQSTTVVGIRFGLSVPATVDDGMGNMVPNPFIGTQVSANLRAYDNTTPPGKPGVLIDTTLAATAAAGDNVYDVTFATAPQLLAAGTYVVTVSEPVGSDALPLSLHVDRYKAGTTWVNWPTSPAGDWANFEFFGASFARTPQVSLLAETSIFKDGFEEAAGVNRPGVQVSHESRPAAPVRPLRKPAPTRLSTKR